MATRLAKLTRPLARRRQLGTGGLGPRRIATVVAVLVIAAAAGNALFAHFWGSGEQAAPAYAVAPAARQTITSQVNTSATVASDKQVKLSFTAAGKIATLDVNQGDPVKAGQQLASLDPTALQNRVDTAQSQLAAAQARLQALLDGPTPAQIAAQQ